MLQQTEVQKSVYTAFRDSPFALQESVKEVYVKAGSSIKEIIDEAIQEEWQRKYLRVVLNDEVIQPENYALTFVSEKDVVGMVLVPQSGDVGQIFKAIAVIAIVVAVTFALGPEGYALVGPALAAGIGATAGLAASLALNALFPPPVPGLPSTGSSGTSEDPVYGFSRTGNQLGKYTAIPRIYGTRKVFPQHAIAPYIIAEGSDQYLYQAFTAGYGPLKIEDIRIGENAIGNYKDVEYYIHEAFEAGDELKIVKEDNWQDPYSIKLEKNVENIIATTDDAEKASLAIQFPQGLFNQWADDGSRHQWTVILDVKVRQAGTSTWFPVTNYTTTITDGVINSITTSNEWTEVGAQYSSDTPNYAVVTELPPSSTVADGERRTLAITVASGDTYFGDNVQTNYITVYQDFENNYSVSESTSEVKVEKTTARPFFTNINVSFPTAGKWEFRVVRLSDDYDGSPTGDIHINPYAETYISSVRSIKNTPPIASDKPVSLIEIKIKATDQLNGAVNNLSCVVKSKLPIWNGSSWSVQETRNPAWAYLDVMRGSASKTPIADSRLDLATFKEWADWCDETQPNFNFVPPTSPNTATNVGFVTNLYYTILYRVPDTDGLNFWVGKLDNAELTRDQVQSFFYQSSEASTINRACCDLEITSQTTAWEVLKLIAATGYATPSQNGGKYSITVDRLRTTPVQIFTPKNIKSFSGNMSYYLKPHALRISYTKTNETDTDEIIVYDDGYNADGSGGKAQATIFEEMKLVGISRYNQAYTIGRRSLAQGQLRIETFTIDCDVENLLATRGSLVRLQHDVPKIGAGSGRIVSVNGNSITIDEPFLITSGNIYGHIRRTDGTQSNCNLYSINGATAIVSGANVYEGDLIVYGELNKVDLECLVKSVRPSNDLTATLELVPYAPAIYTADTEDIPDRNPWGGDWTGGGGGGPTGGNKTTPGLVTSLQGSYQIVYDNKSPKITINLSWGKPYSGGPAYSYKVYYQDSNGWRLLGETQNLSYIAFNEYTFTDNSGNLIDINNKSLKFAVSAVGSDLSSFPPDTAAQVTVIPTISKPSAAITLTAVGGFFENILTWSYQTTGFDVAFVEIWGVMSSNDRGQANLIANVTAPAITYSHTGLDVAQTWYYWIRLVDANGNYSDWYPESATAGVACSPSDDPQYLLDILFGEINADQFAEELNERIDLIDGDGVGSVNERIAEEAQARSEEISQEADARQADITLLTRQQIENAEANAQSALEAVLATNNEALSRKAEVAIAKTELSEKIVEGLSAEAAQRTLLAAKLDTDISTALALINEESTARSDADSAEAAQRNLLAAQFRGNYEGSDLEQVTEGLIYQEKIARATATGALAEQITLLSAGGGEQFDWKRIWYFDGSVDGWTGNGNPTQSGGWLRPANQASNAYVVSPTGIDSEGNKYGQVRLRIRKTGTPTFAGYLWWKAAADTTWDEVRRFQLSEPIFDGNGIGLITANPQWAVSVDSIRIDLSSAQTETDYFEIDWVAVGRPSPGASSAQVLDLSTATVDLTNNTSLASKLTALTASVNDPLTGLEATRTDLSTNYYTKATADEAIASAQQSLISEFGNRSSKIFRQDLPPVQDTEEITLQDNSKATVAKLKTGDIWFETDDGNKPYVFDGSTWVYSPDTSTAASTAYIDNLEEALANGNGAQVTAVRDMVAEFYDPATGYEKTRAQVTENSQAIAESGKASASTGRSLFAAADENAESVLKNLLSNQRSDESIKATLAFINEELKTNIVEGLLAEATLRLQLAAIVDGNTAAIETEKTVRATADGVIAEDLNKISARFVNFETGQTIESYVTDYAYSKAGTDNAIASSANYLVARMDGSTGKSFWQADPPTKRGVDSNNVDIPLVINDAWYETDNGNKLRRWSGTEWVDAADTATVEARVSTVETAKIGYATKNGIVFDNNGTITDKAGVDAWNAAHPSDLAVWHQGIPFASAVKQVAISDGEDSLILEQRFIAQKEVNGSILGKYSVKIDNNGYVTGFGLISEENNGEPVSSFTILADRFIVYDPQDGVERQVFAMGEVNGEYRVGINGDLIVDGSIVADKVRSGVLSGVAIEITNVMNTDAAAGYLRCANVIANSVGGRNSSSWTNASPAVQFSNNTRLVIDGKGEFGNNIYVKGTMLPFTGSHRAVAPLEVNYQPGEIIVDGQLYDEGDMSNTIYFAEKSSVANQRGVIGVFLEDEFRQFEDIDGTITVTNWLDDGNKYVLVNAVGEGKVLVCGENGNISRGDLIVTSSMPGRGMKQDDDIIRGYTVAKAREDVVFSSETEEKLVSCIYLCG